MARITVEDCIDKFESRFELVLVASNRARKIHSGEEPTVEKDNDKNTVIALREIADETISVDDFKQSLVEEYQTISPIDEEDLSLEYNDENTNEDFTNETESEVSIKSAETEIPKELTEDIEKKDDKISEDVIEIETDQSN